MAATTSFASSVSLLPLHNLITPTSRPLPAPITLNTSSSSSYSTNRRAKQEVRGGKAGVSKLNSEISPHRAVAAVRLLRIHQGGAFVDLLNDKGDDSGEREMGYVERTLGFRTRALDDRNVRLVTDIVGGTVRWKRYLDHLMTNLCEDKNMVRDMEPLLLQILRIGFYEILKLDMPAYAVVDENVKLAKASLRVGAGNLVNALLRKLVCLKEKNNIPLPKIEGDDRSKARALATIYSHPVWMVRRWMKYLGPEETVKLMIWNNTDPSFSLRVNPKKGFSRNDLVERLQMLKVPHEVSTYMDDFVRIKTGMQNIIQAGLLKEGLCSVQDESAGMVVSLVDPKPGEMIVDCCAAPGGKTLFMGSRLQGRGAIYAVDINRGRLRILEAAAKLHGVDDVITTIHSDLRRFAEKNDVGFDKVLLDAPCSGLGVLSKRADLRWNRSLEEIEQLQALQDELLDAAALLVKPGGVLVYSTCSIDPQENEERVASLLSRHHEFTVDSAEQYVPDDFLTERGFFFSNPVKHSLDGSFAARMRIFEWKLLLLDLCNESTLKQWLGCKREKFHRWRLQAFSKASTAQITAHDKLPRESVADLVSSVLEKYNLKTLASITGFDALCPINSKQTSSC